MNNNLIYIYFLIAEINVNRANVYFGENTVKCTLRTHYTHTKHYANILCVSSHIPAHLDGPPFI